MSLVYLTLATLHLIVQIDHVLLERLEFTIALTHTLLGLLNIHVELVELPGLGVTHALVRVHGLLMRAHYALTTNRSLFFCFVRMI